MLNKILRRIRRIQVKIHYLRSKFDVVLQNKMPHIKINEKHEKSISGSYGSSNCINRLSLHIR